ncbi:MAG: DUF5895 domain-containing protein [Xenococcaceae cyanobacterium]
MTNTLDLLSQFSDEITTSNRLPYLQIQNPPNMSLAQIEKFGAPFGWFIPAEQAELAEFQTTENYQPTSLVFGEDSSSPREVDGFLTTKVRLCILHRSNIEVQQKATNGWKYLGLAYKSGERTTHGDLPFRERDNYRLRTRYLILLLDDNNQPLHQIPLKIGMNAGVGTAFSQEVRSFRREIEEAFFRSINKPVKALTDRAHALTVLNLQFDVHKSEGKSPFICPSLRFAPSLDRFGQETVVARRDRKVTLVNHKIESLLISKTSETGKFILSLWSEHEDFATKYQNDVADAPQAEEQEAELTESELVDSTFEPIF